MSPDYASHLLPLLQIARRWLGTRGEVVVATGRSWLECRGTLEAIGCEGLMIAAGGATAGMRFAWLDREAGRGE